MTVPFPTSSKLIKWIPYDFLTFNFSHCTPQVWLFLVKKEPKFSVSKMWWKEESENFSLTKYVKLHLESSGKQNWSPCNFETSQVPLSDFNVFRRNPLLGAPVWSVKASQSMWWETKSVGKSIRTRKVSPYHNFYNPVCNSYFFQNGCFTKVIIDMGFLSLKTVNFYYLPLSSIDPGGWGNTGMKMKEMLVGKTWAWLRLYLTPIQI